LWYTFDMPETIGQRLKQIRLSRQLSLEKAAEATRVRVIYLQALENDDYSAMSSAAQGRGFLRLYADFLGLDLEAAMTDMRQTGTTSALSDATPPPVTVDAPSAPAPPPASPADDKPVRRGFWSRLLRRSAPEPSAEAESASEAVTTPAESPAALPVVTEPAPEPEPESPKLTRSTRAKTPAAKKTKSPAKAEMPKNKPRAKTSGKEAGKKKQ
jgi:transcriptional regulator with XRE-family HTH domain